MQETESIHACAGRASSNITLANVIDRVEAIRTRYGISAVQPHLDACRAILNCRGTIDVGIFGRFKAGKSSLLNHIAGRAVLPVGNACDGGGYASPLWTGRARGSGILRRPEQGGAGNIRQILHL